MLGSNPTRDSRMGMTVHNVREAFSGLPHLLMNPIPLMP